MELNKRARCGGLLAAALVCCTLWSAGCSPEATNPVTTAQVRPAPTLTATGDDSRPTSADVPDFTGPWAAEFAEAYQKSGSDFARSALQDGRITDQEVAEMRDKFEQCLTAQGFRKVSFSDDGSFEFDAPEGALPDRVNGQVKACSDESGESSLSPLASAIRRNPDNQDENTIMAACLVRKQVVDSSYGAKDYEADSLTGTFPFVDGVTGEAAYQQCNTDPLSRFE